MSTINPTEIPRIQTLVSFNVEALFPSIIYFELLNKKGGSRAGTIQIAKKVPKVFLSQHIYISDLYFEFGVTHSAEKARGRVVRLYPFFACAHLCRRNILRLYARPTASPRPCNGILTPPTHKKTDITTTTCL